MVAQTVHLLRSLKFFDFVEFLLCYSKELGYSYVAAENLGIYFGGRQCEYSCGPEK